MSLIPQSIPEGAIRFNTDSSKMEVWVGDKWMQVAVSSPNLDGGARGLFGGGGYPNNQNIIDFITISSAGNATDFGDLNNTAILTGSCSSRTRGLFAGDYPSASNVIDFVTMATTGNAIDFGDTLEAKSLRQNGITSDCVRALTAGYSGGNVIEFVTIATTGNSKDFGDLTDDRFTAAALSNGHGGL